MLKTLSIGLLFLATVHISSRLSFAKDVFLTIGGGGSPSSNQASLERNVMFFQRVIERQELDQKQSTVYFADGNSRESDVQVKDPTAIPEANRLMAEFFGSEEDLGIYYRDNQIRGVRGATTPDNIREWFATVGAALQPNDRVVLYVTAHGEESEDRRNPYDTTIALWNNKQITVSEVAELLDSLPDGVSVLTVMVQCHAGGFARLIYRNGDESSGLSAQPRCGFFATLHDRIAAGCTSEVDEETYVEYSTYFWEALSGQTRTGGSVEPPDYDGNGEVSFEEAHAYTLLNADTIDMPIKTSGEFLEIESQFADERHPELLARNTSYPMVFELATAAERAVLKGLSSQLDLTGDDRIATARQRSQPVRRGRRRRSRRHPALRESNRLRQKISSDLQKRWPFLANVVNPGAIELLTSRRHEFVTAITQHASYESYREQLAKADAVPDPEKQRAKHERFVRTTEIAILRENLRRLSDSDSRAQYEAIVALERSSLEFANIATTAH